MQDLSSREHEVAQLVAGGYSNQEISDRLQISIQTVKNHLQSIFRKLSLANRVELALRVVDKQDHARSSHPKGRKRTSRSQNGLQSLKRSRSGDRQQSIS
jgi:DNA-binding CsgD family transcriptional regulator